MRTILLASIAFVLAACAPQPRLSANGDTNEGGSELSACPGTIEISNFTFQPASCSVAPGTTLTFVNRDRAPHTATSDPDAVATFDTGPLENGDSATISFDVAGNYPYRCTFHPVMMQAKIVVTE